LETVRLPYYEMEWEVYFRTIRPEKAEKYLRKLEQALGEEIVSSSCEQWDRAKFLFRIDFTIQIETESIREAVFISLSLCQKVQPWWSVTGPSSHAGDIWEFMGRSKDEAIGVVSIGFGLKNYALQEKSLNSEEH
jgi:hypothetical protein